MTPFLYNTELSNRDLLGSVNTKQGESSLVKVAYTNDFKRYAPIKNTTENFSSI